MQVWVGNSHKLKIHKMKKTLLLLTVAMCYFLSCTKSNQETDMEVFTQPNMESSERSSTCTDHDQFPGTYYVYVLPVSLTTPAPASVSITVAGTAANSTPFSTTVVCSTAVYTAIAIPRTSSPDMGWALTFSTTSNALWRVSTCKFGWNDVKSSMFLTNGTPATPSFGHISTPNGYCLDVVGGEYITQPWCQATVYSKIVKSNGTGYASVTADFSTNLTDFCGGGTSYSNKVYSYTSNGTYIDRHTFTPLLDQDIYGMPQGATDLRVSLHGTNGELSDPDDPENMCTVTGWIQAGNASTQYFNMYINDPAFGWESLNEYNVGGCDY